MIRNDYILFSVLLVVAIACEKPSSTNIYEEPILAIIGNKKITVNDFIKRCEYSPRPNYCNRDNYIHKKIALNSLIAEKILALEFDRNKQAINENQRYFIEGRKEQLMRHLMLKKYGYEDIQLDSIALLKEYQLRNRTYEVEYVIKNENVLKELNTKEIIATSKEKAPSFSVNNISNKNLSYNDQMVDDVRVLLFGGGPELNQAYGPYIATDSTVFYMKVSGWVTRVNISDQQKIDTWESVKNKMTESQALKKYSSYISNLMRGKKIKYDERNFEIFAEKVSRVYQIERSKKEEMIQSSIWESNNEVQIETLNAVKNMKEKNILHHDGKNWTINDIMSLIKKHPLVFRKKNINPNNFANELKFALADLFRDLHITKQGYDLELDQNINVKSETNKWQDYIKSELIKTRYAKSFQKNPNSNNRNNQYKLITNKIDSLQKAYSNKIKINTDKFEEIELLSIDLFGMYSNQAYNNLEPPFPILTNDHLLDYGSKIVAND
jgi:hypothetical protein